MSELNARSRKGILLSGQLGEPATIHGIRQRRDLNSQALTDASLAGKCITDYATLPYIHDRTQTDIIALGGRRSILLNYADPDVPYRSRTYIVGLEDPCSIR